MNEIKESKIYSKFVRRILTEKKEIFGLKLGLIFLPMNVFNIAIHLAEPVVSCFSQKINNAMKGQSSSHTFLV